MRAKVFCALAGLAVAALVWVGTAGAQQQDYRMQIVNGTNTPIEYFYFSECSANNWLNDRLGSNETIAPGQSRIFNMYDGIPDCCRDLRAKFSSGVTREQMGVNVCRASEWVVR